MGAGAPGLSAGRDRAGSSGDGSRSRDTRWDPSQYLTFADHRVRPALELLERVPLANPRRVYDLGCGTGNVTRTLAERWPEARVVGVDTSAEMLARAAEEPGDVEWVRGDVREWEPPEPADLVYSNAVFQWVDGHAALLEHLLGVLAPGGCLAVQMPRNEGAPFHRLMGEVLAGGGPDGTALGSAALRAEVGRRWVEAPEWYYDVLAPHARRVDVWETEYLQVLEGEDAVLEWVRGARLRPILHGLGEREREFFLSEYGRRLRAAYPRRPDGRTLYPFRRLFFVATV